MWYPWLLITVLTEALFFFPPKCTPSFLTSLQGVHTRGMLIWFLQAHEPMEEPGIKSGVLLPHRRRASATLVWYQRGHETGVFSLQCYLGFTKLKFILGYNLKVGGCWRLGRERVISWTSNLCFLFTQFTERLLFVQ